jgi:hypothetical protein
MLSAPSEALFQHSEAYLPFKAKGLLQEGNTKLRKRDLTERSHRDVMPRQHIT